ncbi:MAG: Fe-S cluster assembly protein SufD [Brooklawnia sp.]|uniref:Fe-S cluster assembly protein SufD n=1 Tax=Brooklawnia sp. TaxID=2699740 RepID=UPI003C77DB16
MSTITSDPRPGIASTQFTSHLHPEPSWQLADHFVPTGREETWRFTPVKRFQTLIDASVDGELEVRTSLPEGVTSRRISPQQARELSFDAPVDIVAARAVTGASAGAVLVEVPAGATPSEPLVVELHGDGRDAAVHLLVDIAHQAEVTVVLRHTGSARLAAKVEVHVGEGAQVDIVSVQDWDAGAVHGGQFSVLVGRDAKVRTIQASVGHGDVRLVERAEYAGPGGELEQLGIYFVQSGQHVEHRLLVDHNHPRTVSHVDYRGALQGKGAHSVWIGDVMIRKNAVDIETYESNKNLMLTEGCQADSVPNLEIETGEIRGAGHSSSTGRFDDEQLFYLRSRGIPEEQARRLVVEGFFLDIIRRIGVPQIESRLTEALNAQLASIDGITHEAMLGEAHPEERQ